MSRYIVDPQLVTDILDAKSEAAYSAWSRYQKDNPGAEGPGIFESLYIGAYALLYDGLLTRQGDLYRKYFETLTVLEP